jgi:hypothetical protein
MTTACAPAPPTAVADAWAEMVASLANMVESALTGDGLTGDGLTGDGLTGDGLTGDGPDRRRAERRRDGGRPCWAGRGGRRCGGGGR